MEANSGSNSQEVSSSGSCACFLRLAGIGFAKLRIRSLVSARGNHKAHDESVETQSLSKDEDEDHAHEETWLLRVGTDTSITNNANGKTSGEGTQAHGQASAQMGIALECGV